METQFVAWGWLLAGLAVGGVLGASVGALLMGSLMLGKFSDMQAEIDRLVREVGDDWVQRAQDGSL